MTTDPRPSLRRTIWDWQERAREPSLSVLLFTQIFLIFVLTPLEEMRTLDHWVLDLWIILEGLVSMLIVARDGWARTFMLISVAILLFLPASPMLIGGMEPLSVARTLAALLFVVTVTIVIARAVFSPGRIGRHRIQGGMLIYLNIALGFALIYASVAALLKNPFAGNASDHDFSAMLYFSLTTLTTTGYGDLVPVEPIVRSLANLEAAIGQLFPATLLAGLIGAHLIDRGR